MTERERWIVYPLLFLALGAGLRDKLFDQTRTKSIECQELTVSAEERVGHPTISLARIGPIERSPSDKTPAGQMLIQGGFPLPWDDTVLMPRLPLLDLPGVSLSDPAGLARAGDHLILRVGEWTFWLAVDTTGRFPVVEDAIPRERGGSRLRLDPQDAAFLVATRTSSPLRSPR